METADAAIISFKRLIAIAKKISPVIIKTIGITIPEPVCPIKLIESPTDAPAIIKINITKGSRGIIILVLKKYIITAS